MAYPHDAFPFPMEHQSQGNMYFHPSMQYTSYLQQQQQHQHQPHQDMMMYPHAYSDYTDFMPLGMMPDDYDDGAEISTRPRLTKEQVEVLEAQFQAHPKPNSMIKKQLAIQTKLTLPRVANWFQNRRAKAKQQKKQEEYEIAQNMGISVGWNGESSSATAEAHSKPSSPSKTSSSREDRSESADPRSPSTFESARDASWASLRRALNAADAARQHRQHNQQHYDMSHARAMLAMPPPERPQHNGSSTKSSKSPSRAPTASLSPTSEWPRSQTFDEITSPTVVPVSAPLRDLGFDFGFDQDISSVARCHPAEESPDTGSQHYVVSPSSWTASLSAQTSSMSHHNDFASTAHTSPLTLPAYDDSRRGSGADELTANLGTFALTGTPPVSMVSLHRMAAPTRPTDGEIDLASRRKRPRPAALPLSSLRSRSYGQLSSTSPAFRPGPPSANTLRHVKSTGHSLNSHYAGIRKSSLPQKSPLHLTNFTDAEALKNLMAQQAAAASSKTPLTTPSRIDVGPTAFPQDVVSRIGLIEDQAGNGMSLPSEVLAQFQTLHSPPQTPFQTDYTMQPSSASMPPPSSARSQYASFMDFTPPYSAGPLTNSTCWSDGPLQSPDVTGFPAGHFMSSLSYAQPQDTPVQPWIVSPENIGEASLQNMNMNLNMPDENKKTEFFITEFPGQKEEYASMAQHILQPKPKNYVFANTAPSDYDG